MRTARRNAFWLAAGSAVLVVGAAGCGLMPMKAAGTTRTLGLPAARPSVLVVITDQGSPQAMSSAGALITATAQAGERIVVLGDRGGAVLASSVAPAQPTATVPGPPAPLPAHPTSFQKARYAQAVRDYAAAVRRAKSRLQARQQRELASWAGSVVAATNGRARARTAGTPNVAAALGVAASDFASLQQAGQDNGAAKVIAITGLGVAAADSAPDPPSGLTGSTIVVDGFPGGGNEEAAWQAGLLQAGAARAVLLTPATGDQFAPTVREGLDGAITDTLTDVLFGLGQDTLRAAAVPPMSRLLRLLTVTHPDATVTIDGYTDDLPTPGGNLGLSRRRAQAVEQWLIAHGVAASRLQAAGYGAADPVAPNTPAGQPLNRRVVVVIDPAVPG